MTIHDSKLYLTNKEKVNGPDLPVNQFFNSLTLNSGKKAIGVMPSRLGADGTEGVKAIKNASGTVIARNPETTAFNSMPGNAIATGLVDFILEPELIPGTIGDYIKNWKEILPDNRNDEKT